MKNLSRLLLSLSLMAFGISSPEVLAQEVTSDQDIDILTIRSNAGNRQNACQCDTITINYYLKSGNAFLPGSDFEFQFANPDNDWPNAVNLDLVELCLDGSCNTQASTVADTFRVFPNLLWARLAIPCNANPSNTLRIVNRRSNGSIAAEGVSDTMFFNVGQIPTLAEINYARFPDGSVPQLNAYTSSDPNDLAMCPGDSIILRAQSDGTSYLWYQDDVPQPGPNGLPMPHLVDSFIVTQSGSYRVEVYNGSCSIFSEDTTINIVQTPTEVDFMSAPPNAFQIDNPIPGNFSPDDSIQFCEDKSFVLRANAPPPGITFRYRWIRDSTTVFGNQVFYNTRPGDTNQTITIDSSLIDIFPQNFYVIIDDGFCVDTSEAQMVFMDTMPHTQILWQNYSNGALGPVMSGDVCMRDSTLLSSSNTPSTWRYQWQRLNTSAVPNPVWEDLPNTLNPNVDGSNPTLQVDTSIKPIRSLSYYRLVTHTITPHTQDIVCTSVSDSVRVRWFPIYNLNVLPGQPWANIVGPNEVSICESDSVTVLAPLSPNNFSLPYTYQWLTDSVALGGGRVIYPTGPGDTLRSFTTSTPGRYYVVIDDGICHDTSVFFRAHVDSLPRTTLVPAPGESLDLCLYDSTTITATDTVLPFWDYQWEQYVEGTGWTTMVNDTNPSLQVDTSHIVNNDTLYFRLNTSYANQFGLVTCPYTTDSIMVVFYEAPLVTLHPSDSIGLCFMDSVFVVAEGEAFTYQWVDLSTAGASRYIHSPGTYIVRGTGVNGCVTEKELHIYDLQISGNASGDQTIESGEIATLHATGGTSYRWYASKPIDFNDFLSDTIRVSKTLDDDVLSDTITMYVLITNGEGCRKLDSLTLFIQNPKDESLVLLENVYNMFTPNGDPYNEVWDISRIIQGRACEIMIMNRWGSIVFEDDSNWNGIWNGNDDGGNPLPDGTYYYVLSCDDEVVLKSAVTLIRND